MLNQNKKRISQGILMGLTLVTIVSFSNCGQPGAINLQNTDQALTDIQSTTPVSTVPPVVIPKNLVAKQTEVNISNLTNKKIDILVVIDNSVSMATEQKSMSSRFNTFIDQLNGLDWQIGIVTTDVSADTEVRDGRLLQYRGGFTGRVLSSKMDLAVAKASFGATIQRTDPNASGDEQGIAASYRAVERSQITGSDNVALFRADAALAIVIVTDADESPKGGIYGSKNDPSNLLSLIKGLWPQKSVVIHSIVVKSGDKDCLAKDGNESYGKVYEGASTTTGGIIGSVCATDYSGQLAQMGQSSAALINSITLECQPVDANGDGQVDMEVRDPNMTLVSAYSLAGVQVKFSSPLSLGKTTVKYYCL